MRERRFKKKNKLVHHPEDSNKKRREKRGCRCKVMAGREREEAPQGTHATEKGLAGERQSMVARNMGVIP